MTTPGAPPVVTSVRFCVFGGVRAEMDGTVLPLGAPKQRAVLALLLLDAGRVVPTSRLIAELWGDDPPASAMSTLRSYLSRLRTALEPVADSPPGLLRRRAHGYLLHIAPQQVDAHQFARLVSAAGSQLETDPERARSTAEEALDLVGGEPLADVLDSLGDVGVSEAQRLADLVAAARHLRFEALLRTGHERLVADEGPAVLQHRPTDEALAATVLLGLYRAGRQAEALAGYERVRAVLDEELGVDPAAALRRLHGQLLRQDPALDPPPPPRVSDPPSTSSSPPAAAAPDFPLLPPASESAPLFGREAPLAALVAALPASDRGFPCLVSGEPGIGKSRLCAEAAGTARRGGVQVLWGRSQESAGGAPLWPWRQILQASPDLFIDGPAAAILGDGPAPPGMPSATARLLGYQALCRSLVQLSLRTPLLIVVEDLHWADESSLELFGLVAETCAVAPISVIGTVRNAGSTRSAALQALLGLLSRTPGLQRIELAGLSAGSAAELVAATAGLAPDDPLTLAAVSRADGNPFFLRELAAIAHRAVQTPDLIRDVPPSVRDFLAHRIGALPEPAQTVLRSAAVLGRSCDLDVLMEVADRSADEVDDALEHAVRAGLVSEQLFPRPGLRFSHALVQETLLTGMRLLVRARLHARVGLVLAHRVDSDPDEVAFHLSEGGAVADPALVVESLLRAADSGVQQLAYEHALGRLDRAVEVIIGIPDGPRRDALELTVQTRRGTLLTAMHGYAAPTAVQAATRALELAERVPFDPQSAVSLYGSSAARLVGGDFDGIDRLAQAFLGSGDDAGGHNALLGHGLLGTVRWHQGRPQEAVAELTLALELIPAADPQLLSALVQDLEVSLTGFRAAAMCRLEDHRAADRQIARAVELAERSDDPPTLTFAYWFAALVAAFRRDPLRTAEWAVRCRAVADRHGFAFWQAMARQLESWADVRLATTPQTLDVALTAARGATALYESTGARMLRPLFDWLLADAELVAGNPQRAVAAAERGLAESVASGERLAVEELAEVRDFALLASG